MVPEDIVLKKIMDLQVILMNKHKIPTLFSYTSKYGQVTFGGKSVSRKFRGDFDEEWEDAFETDQDDVMSVGENEEYFNSGEWGSPFLLTRSRLLPWKLPADLSLMVYKELWHWISAEILKDYWKRGGEKKEVRYGHEDFAPSFWPNDIWAWEEVHKNPKNLKASDFPGDGTITEFLKKVVKIRLEQLEIDPAEHVSNKFNDKNRKDRQKKRGKSFPSQVSAPEVPDEAPQVPENGEGDDTNTSEDSTNTAAVNVTTRTEFSEILASNDIDINSSATHPNISGLFESIAGATSTLSRHSNVLPPPLLLSPLRSPSHARPNIIASARLEVSQAAPFTARRRRPSDLNDVAPPPKRRTPPPPPQPACAPVRRSRRSRTNIPKALNVDVGPPRPGIPILVPTNLVELFGSVCADATQNGWELGGVLAGVYDEDDDLYRVSHVVIPQQSAEAVGWMVGDERQITNFFITHPDLLFLGFVHSQPDSGPLTSIDLHSLFTYARRNPAIVSLVFGPQDTLYKAFSLTSLGLEELSECRKNGLHQHKSAVTRLAKVAENVVNDENREIILIDYRLFE